MPWTLLFSFLSAIPGAFGKYFDNKTQIELQRQQNILALEQERSKLVAQGIIAQSDLGQEQIRATSTWFKQTCFLLLLAPIVITCFDDAWGSRIFNSLNIVPEWYIAIVSTLYFAIWGINSDKVASLVQSRREFKLEKLRINRQAYWDDRRKQGPVTQAEVTQTEKVFNELDARN